MVIDYHGHSKPTGLSRTYPNILTVEGVHGLENTKWEGADWMPKCDFPECDLTDYFCRMTAGPMDYTPGAMRNFNKEEYRSSQTLPGSQGTRVHQLAMFTMFESPLQMLCDSPTKYERNMECFEFMAKTPVVWDDTVGLGGTPETFAAVARRAKDGSWYAAAITNRDAREFELKTGFLGGGEWKAEVFRDAPECAEDPARYLHEKNSVMAGEALRFKMAPGGGFVVRFSK
jgi:alpha-glucosidase